MYHARSMEKQMVVSSAFSLGVTQRKPTASRVVRGRTPTYKWKGQLFEILNKPPSPLVVVVLRLD